MMLKGKRESNPDFPDRSVRSRCAVPDVLPPSACFINRLTRLISAALVKTGPGATTLADATIGHFVNASPPPPIKRWFCLHFPPEGTIGRHNDGIHAAELRSFTEILLLMSFVLTIS